MAKAKNNQGPLYEEAKAYWADLGHDMNNLAATEPVACLMCPREGPPVRGSLVPDGWHILPLQEIGVFEAIAVCPDCGPLYFGDSKPVGPTPEELAAATDMLDAYALRDYLGEPREAGKARIREVPGPDLTNITFNVEG